MLELTAEMVAPLVDTLHHVRRGTLSQGRLQPLVKLSDAAGRQATGLLLSVRKLSVGNAEHVAEFLNKWLVVHNSAARVSPVDLLGLKDVVQECWDELLAVLP